MPKDAPAENELVALAARLRLSTARLARRLRQQSGTGLTLSQFSALAAIDHHSTLTLGELAEHEQVAPPTITKLVGQLEAAGLVARRPDPGDRRICRVETTAAGDVLLTETRERRDAWLTVRLRALGAADRQRLADAVEAFEQLTGGTS